MALCSLNLTAGQGLFEYFNIFLAAVEALWLRTLRNLPAYFPDQLIDHLSALKVQLGK
jgi:hypothetical protein